MTKGKKGKKKSGISSKKKTPPRGKPRKSGLLLNPASIIVFKAFLVIAAIILLTKYNDGYDRLYNYDVLRVFNDFEKYGDLDLAERREALFGNEYSYYSMINSNTDENAVILFPPKKYMRNNRKAMNWSRWGHNKSYVTYFLYPRKVLYDGNDDNSPYYDSITHVAVLNGWGYDKAGYTRGDRPAYTIIPMQ